MSLVQVGPKLQVISEKGISAEWERAVGSNSSVGYSHGTRAVLVLVVGLCCTMSTHWQDHLDGTFPTAAAPVLGGAEHRGARGVRNAPVNSRWSAQKQLCSLSGLLPAHPSALQIRTSKSTFLRFPEWEVWGRLILILPETTAHEPRRNRSGLSVEFRLCNVSNCFFPSQCKTLFPFTSHYFFLQNAFSADNAHEGTMQPVVWEKKPVFF